MAAVNTWSTTAADNDSAAPDGFPEGMSPSDVNDSCREVMAAIATWRTAMDATAISLSSYEVVALDSTEHALQISPDTGVNIAIGINQIQCRNDGATSTLYLNHAGGAVNIGSDQDSDQDITLTSGATPSIIIGDDTVVTLAAGQTLTHKELTDPVISQIQLGHASDTTLSRVSAGVVAVEGNQIAHIVYDDDITLTGSFSTNIHLIATRVSDGLHVTMYMPRDTFSSTDSPLSQSAAIPSAYQPAETVACVYDINTNGVYKCFVSSAGQIGGWLSVHTTGETTAFTDTNSAFSMSWYVAD